MSLRRDTPEAATASYNEIQRRIQELSASGRPQKAAMLRARLVEWSQGGCDEAIEEILKEMVDERA